MNRPLSEKVDACRQAIRIASEFERPHRANETRVVMTYVELARWIYRVAEQVATCDLGDVDVQSQLHAALESLEKAGRDNVEAIWNWRAALGPEPWHVRVHDAIRGTETTIGEIAAFPSRPISVLTGGEPRLQGVWMPILSHETLRKCGYAVFVAAGLPEDQARIVTDHLVDANLMGHDSHGIHRMPGYARGVKAGTIKPAGNHEVVRETPASLTIDAGRRNRHRGGQYRDAHGGRPGP